jgi:hypothetical protein
LSLSFLCQSANFGPKQGQIFFYEIYLMCMFSQPIVHQQG